MDDHHIIIFDGVCNFCHRSVNFIIKYDHDDKFIFVPMQSPIAQKLIAKYHFETYQCDSLILIKNEISYTRSDAIIQIIRELDGYWRMIVILNIIPKPIRDYFYTLFSKHRYRLFGKKENCPIPNAEVRNKFLN